jgi:hypothetical protein
MIENYSTDEFGVVHQINSKPFNYDMDYQNSYNKLGELGPRMANLRLGYIIGAIGTTPSSIIDIGPGNGDFVRACKNIIPSVYFHDTIKRDDLKGIKYADKPYKLNVDVITFFDSIEHMSDLSFVKDIKAKIVVISVPSCNNPQDDKWFESWKHRKPDEHLHHFNADSLIRFMMSNGWYTLNMTNIEDTIRKSSSDTPNIITGVFYRK